MKYFRTLLVAMVVMASITMFSCKDNKAKMGAATQTQGKEFTAAYVCPMHCKDSGSDKEGKCDTCGMTLVKNEAHYQNGHTHE